MFQIAFVVLAGFTFIYYVAFVSYSPQNPYTAGISTTDSYYLGIFSGMEKEKTKWKIPAFNLNYVLYGGL